MSFLKNRVINETAQLKAQLHPAEYIVWWLLRLIMIVTIIIFIVKGEAVYQRNLLLLNTLATFAIPILRFISPKKLFFSRVSFHIQSYIDIFIFLGSFLGHGLRFLGEVYEYDKFMHIIAGGVVVFIGAELLKSFKGNENVPAGIKTFCGVGFSFIIIVAWEIMEFFADWFITASCNQGYNIVPDSTMFFVKIFGMSKNPGQAPLYDTNADMFYAVIGCALCTAILFAVLKKKEAKKLKGAEERAEATAS